MTSRQHLQPALENQTPAFKTTAIVCASLAFNRVIVFTLSIVIGLIILTTYNQPLLAQTEVTQPVTSQADTEAIRREILLLGDTDPTVRKNARAAVENFGNAAINELKKAVKFETTKDYETQIVAAKILANLQHAIALKEADKFVRGEKELEGWPAFKNLTEDTPESRSLFRDIYLQNHKELLLATSPPVPGTNRKYAASYTQLKNLFESSDLTQVCFGMFLLARKQNEQESTGTNTGLQAIHVGPSLIQIKHLFDTLAAKRSPLAKLNNQGLAPVMLVRAIIESAPQAPQILTSKISLIQQIKSKEISPLLITFAAPENPTVIRVQAIEHAIKIGDKDAFKKLNTYLDDTTEVGKYLVSPDDAPASQRPKQQISLVQIRDLILLGNLRLNKQDHAEFGFRPEAIHKSTNKFNVKQAGFVNNEMREEAFKRFRSTAGNNVSPQR